MLWKRIAVESLVAVNVLLRIIITLLPEISRARLCSLKIVEALLQRGVDVVQVPAICRHITNGKEKMHGLCVKAEKLIEKEKGFEKERKRDSHCIFITIAFASSTRPLEKAADTKACSCCNRARLRVTCARNAKISQLSKSSCTSITSERNSGSHNLSFSASGCPNICNK